MNRNLVLAAIVTGILCGAWAGLAPLVGLSIWAGFAGCTAYFALGTPGLKGLALTLSTTLVGILTALGMIALGDLIGTPAGTGIAVGVIVAIIVLMGAVKWLAFDLELSAHRIHRPVCGGTAYRAILESVSHGALRAIHDVVTLALRVGRGLHVANDSEMIRAGDLFALNV